MSLNILIQQRSNNTCELCNTPDDSLISYTVPPKTDNRTESQVGLCAACFDQISKGDYSNIHNWRCLEGSIWSEVPAVKVLSYQVLIKLINQDWAKEAIDAVYFDNSLLAWANAEDTLAAEKNIHKDGYGVILESGDTVILIQNLNVKGTNYIAPKGTIVRKIKLIHENAEQVEGKINGDTIVILTKFVRKSV